MGNSESNTPEIMNTNIPIKPAIKKTRVTDPVNGYNYYPSEYIPEPNAYPVDPANDPVVSNENDLQNKFYPRPKTKNKVLIEPDPTYHHNHDHRSHHHHHHHHRRHDQHRYHSHHHHDHHHHQHRSALPSEKERFNPPIFTERATSPNPPSALPSFQAQKPVSSVVTYKLTSPFANKELRSPSPLPVRQLPSVIAKKSATTILPEKPLNPVIVNQHQSPRPKSIPSFFATSNNFEKAPVIEINYIPRSPSSHSLYKYGPGTMSIVRRSSSQFITPGNRWYDHDYDKRIKPLTINDV